MLLATPAFDYERLAGTAKKAARASWLRRHVRAPAWRLLVPKGVAKGVGASAPPEVEVERVRGGLFAAARAPTPWAFATTEPIEAWLLPLLG